MKPRQYKNLGACWGCHQCGAVVHNRTVHSRFCSTVLTTDKLEKLHYVIGELVDQLTTSDGVV